MINGLRIALNVQKSIICPTGWYFDSYIEISWNLIVNFKTKYLETLKFLMCLYTCNTFYYDINYSKISTTKYDKTYFASFDNLSPVYFIS